MTTDMWLGVVRTLLATGGGVLVGKGLLDDGTMQSIIGAIMVLVTAGWSIVAKKKAS